MWDFFRTRCENNKYAWFQLYTNVWKKYSSRAKYRSYKLHWCWRLRKTVKIRFSRKLQNPTRKWKKRKFGYYFESWKFIKYMVPIWILLCSIKYKVIINYIVCLPKYVNGIKLQHTCHSFGILSFSFIHFKWGLCNL